MNQKNTKQKVRLVGAGLVPAHIKGKTQKGITLIALVITIIVLLILAGVTISMVLGDDGIIQNAKKAKEENENAVKNEQTALDIVSGNTDKYIEGTAANKAEKGELEIGDYVNFTHTAGTYTADASRTGGATTQSFDSTNKDIRWRVLTTKEGIITLVSEYGTENLTLDGAAGYLNGPDVLNEMCKALYSGKYGEARSINEQDLIELFLETNEALPDENYAFAELTNGTPKYVYRGSINAYNWIPVVGDGTIGSAAAAEGAVFKEDNRATPDGKNIEDYKINHFLLGFNNSQTKDMIFNADIHTWLADKSVYPQFFSSDQEPKVRFGLKFFDKGAVGGGYDGTSTKALFYNNGETTAESDAVNGEWVYTSYKVRPVVQLKAGVKIEWSETDSEWQIIEN